MKIKILMGLGVLAMLMLILNSCEQETLLEFSEQSIQVDAKKINPDVIAKGGGGGPGPDPKLEDCQCFIRIDNVDNSIIWRLATQGPFCSEDPWSGNQAVYFSNDCFDEEYHPAIGTWAPFNCDVAGNSSYEFIFDARADCSGETAKPCQFLENTIALSIVCRDNKMLPENSPLEPQIQFSLTANAGNQDVDLFCMHSLASQTVSVSKDCVASL